MGIISEFILGCLVTVWWKAKASQKESSRRAARVKPEGNGYLETARRGLREAGQRATEVRMSTPA